VILLCYWFAKNTVRSIKLDRERNFKKQILDFGMRILDLRYLRILDFGLRIADLRYSVYLKRLCATRRKRLRCASDSAIRQSTFVISSSLTYDLCSFFRSPKSDNQ